MQSDVQTGLRNFLLAILSNVSPLEVVAGQNNRTPEPKSPNFVVTTPILRERLETNTDSFADVSFVGSIAGTVITVTSIAFGTIAIGQTLFGAGIATGTTITALGSGMGGVGTYTVSASQTIGSEAIASGTETILQPTRLTIQCDFHSMDLNLSADMAQKFTTLWRDAYGVDYLAPYGVAPLYTSEPRQLAWRNGEQQTENRWTVDAIMQVNEQVSDLPQQFADVLDIGIIDVDVAYPA